MKKIIKKILKEDRQEQFLNKIILLMKDDYPLIKNMENYGFNLSQDELAYVLSGIFKKDVQIVFSYYTQFWDEFGNLLYMEVDYGCLKGAFVNYVDDVDNISLYNNDECVWGEASDLMYYIESFFEGDFEPLSLDEFLSEHSSILNQTMKNDIQFLLNI